MELELDLEAMAPEDTAQLELDQALLVLGLVVLELVAMAKELVLGQGVLDLVGLVDMGLVDKDLGQGSLLNQVMAHRWVELVMDQVISSSDAYKYFIKGF